MNIYGPDQNIGSPEKFCPCDVEHFRISAIQRVQKMKMGLFWCKIKIFGYD